MCTMSKLLRLHNKEFCAYLSCHVTNKNLYCYLKVNLKLLIVTVFNIDCTSYSTNVTKFIGD